MNTLAVIKRFIASANPGANLIDLLPSLDRLPDFLAPWRAAALHQQKVTQSCFMGLLNEVKEKISHGELAHDGVFAARLLQDTRRSGFLGGKFIVSFIQCDMNSTVGCIRICPGKLLAVNSLFLVLLHLCYAFDIEVKE
jgi:hypothetical protein